MEITTESLDKKTAAMMHGLRNQFNLNSAEYVYLKKILQGPEPERWKALRNAAEDLQDAEAVRAAADPGQPADYMRIFRTLAEKAVRLGFGRREHIAFFQWVFYPQPLRDAVTDAIIRISDETRRQYAPDLVEEARREYVGTSSTPPAIIDISGRLARPRRK